MRCMYCNKEIQLEECHNPEDFGLHTQYLDFSNKNTCLQCNNLITITNRYLKGVLDTNYSENSLINLKMHIDSLVEKELNK